MCKLEKNEFHFCRLCSKELAELIKKEKDPAILADKILDNYSFDTIIFVLSSFILENEDHFVNTSLWKWAKRYEPKIGFLKGLLTFNAPPMIVKELFILLLRRYKND